MKIEHFRLTFQLSTFVFFFTSFGIVGCGHEGPTVPKTDLPEEKTENPEIKPENCLAQIDVYNELILTFSIS